MKKIFDILEERESKVVKAMRYDNVYIADLKLNLFNKIEQK